MMQGVSFGHIDDFKSKGIHVSNTVHRLMRTTLGVRKFVSGLRKSPLVPNTFNALINQ